MKQLHISVHIKVNTIKWNSFIYLASKPEVSVVQDNRQTVPLVQEILVEGNIPFVDEGLL